MDEKVVKILKKTFKCAAYEALGSSEHICEYVNPEVIYDVLEQNGVDVSDLTELKEKVAVAW